MNIHVLRHYAWVVFFVGLYVFVCLPCGYAEGTENPVMTGPVITGIHFDGLKRTRPQVAEKLLERFIGITESELNENDVITSLLNTGLFTDISVTVGPSGVPGEALLFVNLTEKWSLIPVPVFGVSSDGIIAGAVLIDTNVFGSLNTLMLGGLWLPDGWQTMGMFNISAKGSRIPRFSVMGMIGRRESKEVDINEDIIRSFGKMTIIGGVGIGYPIHLPHSMELELKTGIAFHERGVYKIDSMISAPDSGRTLDFQAGAVLRSQKWDGIFISARSISADYSWSLGLINNSFHQISLNGVFEYPFIPGLKGIGRLGIGYNPFMPPVFESSARGVSILPSDMVSSDYVIVSAGLEGMVFKLPFGVISVLASWQTLWSRGTLYETRLDYGVTGGIRLYIAQLAVPAVDIGVSYNVKAKLFRFSAGVGMSM